MPSHTISMFGLAEIVSCFCYSGKKLEEVYHELQTYDGTSPMLVSQFEGALSSLLEDVKQVLADNEKLKHMFTKYAPEITRARIII